MDVLWKMESIRNGPSPYPGMIPGKNMKKSGRNILVEKGSPFFTVIFPGKKNHEGKKEN